MPRRSSSHRLRLGFRMGALAAAAVLAGAVLSGNLTGDLHGAAPEAGEPSDAQVVAVRATFGDLAFSSFLGGLEWDEATGVGTDRQGNTYLTGFTVSKDFPAAERPPRRHAALVDAFVTKVSVDRSRVVWSTRIGGVDLDSSNALTVDRAGNVYVVGRTGSPNFPTLPTLRGLRRNLMGHACTGEPCHDAFVVKLDATGRVLWSTTFGGSGSDEALGVAADDSGAVYLAGLTDSPDLPLRRAFQDRFQSLPCEGDVPCPYDAFVAKLAPDGHGLVYSTYLGGAAGDVARGVVVDHRGNAYVAGSTASPDFPTVRALQGGMGGRNCGPPPGEPCRQAFLTKLSPDGRSASYSTFLGGREHDDAYSVAVDDSHCAYVTGSTQSPDFPTRKAVQGRLRTGACLSEQPLELCGDGFVTAFARTGRALRYSTYLGGRAEDQGLTIDVAPNGKALVGGRTDSADFKTSASAAQSRFGGYIDGFAVKLRASGTPMWRTFLGGMDADRVTGIGFGRGGSAHIVGRTLSTDFPTVRPFQPELEADDYDAFVSVVE